MTVEPELAKLGHVALVTPDIERSFNFFHEVLGLEESGRSGDTIFLRAWGDFEHHSLSLTPGPEAYIEHVAWRAKRSEDVEGFAARLRKAGCTIHAVEAGAEEAQGPAIRFDVPGGHTFEIYYEMRKALPPAGQRSRLRNQVSPSWTRGISPRRIDHVNVRIPNPEELHEWLVTHLGFKVRERIRLNDGTVPAAWLSVTPFVHDIAVNVEKTGQLGRFHHVAFWTDERQDILRAADILRENGVRIDAGPGKHGISQAFYLYFRDPGSGLRIELFSGGYLILEPDWAPVEWPQDALEDGLTWWGQTTLVEAMQTTTGRSRGRTTVGAGE